MSEIKTENQKIKLIKVKQGTLSCVGDVMQIEGDFELIFDECGCGCKKESEDSNG